MSLARLEMQYAGSRKEGTRLHALCMSFTERFDTRDLRDASSLLHKSCGADQTRTAARLIAHDPDDGKVCKAELWVEMRSSRFAATSGPSTELRRG
jgi:hypothetical protein